MASARIPRDSPPQSEQPRAAPGQPRQSLALLVAQPPTTTGSERPGAKRRALDAGRLASEGGDPPARATALRLAGRAASLAGDFEGAIQTLHQALVEYESIGDHAGAAQTLVACGRVYESLADAGTALHHYRQAAALEEETGNRAGRARTLRRISRLLTASGNADGGLDEGGASLVTCVDLGDAAEHARALVAVGVALRALARNAESCAALVEAVELLRRNDGENEADLVEALCELGSTLGAVGELAHAHAAWIEAGERAARAGNAPALSRAWLGRGRLALARSNLPEARRALGEALAHALRAEDRRLRAECHRALATLHRKAGDAQEALTQLDDAAAIEADLRDAELRDRLRAAQLRYQSSAGGLIDHVEIRSTALAKAFAELETLNASLRAADRAKTELLSQLERKTFEDALTGLHNRRYAELRLAEEFQRATRHQRGLTVAIIDIDGFRRINEIVSHAAADQTLKLVAGVISRTVRSTDITARYGSDQFVVLFPDTDAAGAHLACEKIREEAATALGGGQLSRLAITVSVGIAGATGLPNHEKMLAVAERRLAAAKVAGGNQVRPARQG